MNLKFRQKSRKYFFLAKINVKLNCNIGLNHPIRLVCRIRRNYVWQNKLDYLHRSMVHIRSSEKKFSKVLLGSKRKIMYTGQITWQYRSRIWTDIADS